MHNLQLALAIATIVLTDGLMLNCSSVADDCVEFINRFNETMNAKCNRKKEKRIFLGLSFGFSNLKSKRLRQGPLGRRAGGRSSLV